MSTLQQQTSPTADKNKLPLSQTDPDAAKQKAAEHKLQLLATFQAMQREGKLPHNAQLHELLDKLIENRVISSREHLVSEDGKLLLNDFRNLLRTLQKALSHKNKDELFQSLVYHLHCMESPISKDHVNQAVKSHDQDTMKDEGKKASSALFNILKLMLINNEFRSVLGELLDISQDIFNDVAGKAGQSLQDAGSNLQDDNTTDRSGKHFVDRALDKALDYAERPKDREHKRNSLHDQEPRLLDASKDDPRHKGLLNTGDSVHPAAIPGGFPRANDESNNFQDASLQHPMYHGGRQEELQKPKEQVLNHPMYQDTRNKLQEHKEHARQTANEKMPKDKQDELIRRLQRALAQVQDHPDYQESINTIIHLVKVWGSRLSNVTGDLKQQAKQNDHPQQADYRDQAEREVKAIIEIWAQGHSIDPLLQAIQNVTEDMRNDEHLRDYYHTVFDYLHRLVKEPGYISTDRSIDDGKRLMDAGRDIVKGRYGDHLDNLSSQGRRYVRLIADDEVSRDLAHSFNRIHRDLWMDREGNPAFKPQLFNDMKMTLLPAFIDEIRYIPIPRIEYSDPQFDIVIENLILSGDTLLPNLVETKIDSFSSFSLREDTVSKPDHQSLFIRLNEIQADISDVVFFYKKKTGFPKLSDRGVANVTIGGKGISVAVRIQNVTENPAKTFKVSYCKCNVSNIKIKINDSNHDILYKTIRPLVIGQIRKQIARGIEGKIIETLNQLDQKVTKSLVNFNQQMQNKAYDALPEEEKMRQPRPSVSQARPRPGLFSTLVSMMNRNIKARVDKRNARKRNSMMSGSDSGSSSPVSNTDRQELGTQQFNQQEPGYHHNALQSHHKYGAAALEQQHQDPTYNSSLDTGRHHHIDSPPHSPPKKHTVYNDNENEHFTTATDLANTQQPNQIRTTQI